MERKVKKIIISVFFIIMVCLMLPNIVRGATIYKEPSINNTDENRQGKRWTR